MTSLWRSYLNSKTACRVSNRPRASSLSTRVRSPLRSLKFPGKGGSGWLPWHGAWSAPFSFFLYAGDGAPSNLMRN